MQVIGVNSDGRLTTVHPAASAAATERATLYAGKFHAVIVPTTPTGWCSTIIRLPGTRLGMMRP